MKKSSLRQAEQPKTAPEYGFRKLRPLKIPKKAWYAGFFSVFMALALFSMYAFTFLGTKELNKTLLIYSDGSKIYEVSLRNSLAAAGFNYAIIEPEEKADDPDFKYELPHEFKKEDVVVCAIGTKAFKVMDDLLSSGSENIEGYVLINPDYPGNVSLEGYTSDNPTVPCAIFGPDNGAKTSTELSGSQMIFEKISGVDTMYGHPTTRGRIFSSKVFVSPNQMRYLSLSSTDFGTELLMVSPSFQNELAQYLGTTFGKGYSPARVTVWTLVLSAAIFLSAASLALFLFLIPVAVPEKAKRELKGRNSLGAIIFLGLSGWLALCGVIMDFIPQTSAYTKYVAMYSPVLLIALMALAQLKLLISNKFKYTRKDDGMPIFLASILTAAVEIMIVLGTALNLSRAELEIKDTTNLINALVIFVIMSLSAVALILSDKKSRASGQGRSAYFASPIYFIEVLFPAAALLVFAVIRGNGMLMDSALTGIGLSIVPVVCAIPIKRVSDYYEVSGLVFGVIAALIIFIV